MCEDGGALSVHAFVLVLLGAAAALALWILAGTQLRARTLGWAIAHVIAAMALLQFVSVPLGVINGSGLPAARFLCVFGVALPLFVYTFLSAGWITRLSIGLLR